MKFGGECVEGDQSDFMKCIDIVAEPANRGTMFLTQEMINVNEVEYYRSGLFSVTLLDETIVSQKRGFVYKPFSPFFETFNEKIDEMLSSGIVEYWNKKLFNPSLVKRTEEEVGPQVLTMEHLEVGFISCLIFLILSIFVFLLEVFIPLIKSSIKKLFSFWVFKRLIKAFMRKPHGYP